MKHIWKRLDNIIGGQCLLPKKWITVLVIQAFESLQEKPHRSQGIPKGLTYGSSFPPDST